MDKCAQGGGTPLCGLYTCSFEEETHTFQFTKHVPDEQYPSSVTGCKEN